MIAGNPEAMARVVEGIITGMGFIGGGAILRMKDSVRGGKPLGYGRDRHCGLTWKL
jgi:hypothetical protein